MMVELACGVNVALCYDGRLEKALGRPVRREDKVVIVLCGGSNVTSGMLCEWRSEYGSLLERELELQRTDSAYTSAEASPKTEACVSSELEVPVLTGIEVGSLEVRV
jgi:L-serine/L-threonine ammonia-lyase